MKFRALLQFETYKYLKSSLTFSVIWIGLIFLFLSFFDTIKESSDQLTQLYASFPKELLEMFGKGIDSLSSIYGYFGNSVMTYLVISGVIFAISITAGSLAGEIGNRNILFLISKPLSRLNIYISKLAGITTGLLVSNVLLFIITVLAVETMTRETNVDWSIFALNFVALFLLEIFFVGLTFVLSAKFSSGKATAICAGIFIGSYSLNILAGLTEDASFFKYLSPNYYLDTAAIVIEKSLKPESILIVLLTIILVIIGGYLFKKRDVS